MSRARITIALAAAAAAAVTMLRHDRAAACSCSGGDPHTADYAVTGTVTAADWIVGPDCHSAGPVRPGCVAGRFVWQDCGTADEAHDHGAAGWPYTMQLDGGDIRLTAEDGSYELCDLAPGTHELRLFTPDFQSHHWDLTAVAAGAPGVRRDLDLIDYDGRGEQRATIAVDHATGDLPREVTVLSEMCCCCSGIVLEIGETVTVPLVLDRGRLRVDHWADAPVDGAPPRTGGAAHDHGCAHCGSGSSDGSGAVIPIVLVVLALRPSTRARLRASARSG